jgi:hypothetical protein
MRGLQEVVPVQDTVCSGLGAIERLGGGLYRFWFYIEQTDDDGHIDKIVVSKLIVPSSAIPDGILKTIAAISTAGTVVPLASIPELSH